MVALSVSGRTLPECRSESRSHQLLMDLRHLPVQVTSYDDVGLCILPDDALYEADDCLCPLHHEPFLARFQVYVEDVDFLPRLAVPWTTSGMYPALSPCCGA